jgi:hypothetical protein
MVAACDARNRSDRHGDDERDLVGAHPLEWIDHPSHSEGVTDESKMVLYAYLALSRVLFEHVGQTIPQPSATDVRLYLRRHAH